MTTTQPQRLTPSDVNELLDDRGLHDASRGPGCYALELDVPDSVEAAHRRWLAHVDTLPRDDGPRRFAEAPRCAYVGAGKNVYERLDEHARGEERSARYPSVYPPVDVIDVWPARSTTQAFDHEYGRATDLARQGWAVACNGVVVG